MPLDATTAVPVLPVRLLSVLTSSGDRFVPLLVRFKVTVPKVPPVMIVWLLPPATPSAAFACPSTFTVTLPLCGVLVALGSVTLKVPV